MGWISKIFGATDRQAPPPAPISIDRWPGGTVVIDLGQATLDAVTFSRVTEELSRLEAPRMRVWLLSTAALRDRARDPVTMQEFLQRLHAASLGRDASGKLVPDVAVLAGELGGVMGAAYLLWSLGVEPFPLAADGELPVIEAKTARGEWIAGAHGQPIGKEPSSPVLRGINLTRDKLEAEPVADVLEEAARVEKLLDIATKELSFIDSVLQSMG
jgi:hypothetical protein